jgi:hypothetical protein
VARLPRLSCGAGGPTSAQHLALQSEAFRLECYTRGYRTFKGVMAPILTCRERFMTSHHFSVSINCKLNQVIGTDELALAEW